MVVVVEIFDSVYILVGFFVIFVVFVCCFFVFFIGKFFMIVVIGKVFLFIVSVNGIR